MVMHGETAIAGKRLSEGFQGLIQEESYSPDHWCNSIETDLFWMRMSNRSYITREVQRLPGHKPINCRYSFFKVKPPLVYNREGPRAFKKKAVVKSELPVFWKSNQKDWVTRPVFKEWILEVFASNLKTYLEDKTYVGSLKQ